MAQLDEKAKRLTDLEGNNQALQARLTEALAGLHRWGVVTVRGL